VTDANGVSVTNTFDALHRLSTRTYPDGGVEKFGYSARGLVAYTNQLDKVTFYGYDEAMRKTWETNANNEIIRYTNNAAGDLLSLTDGKNQTTKWNYDEYGRVTNKLDQVGTEILRYKI
jgi:YD repeat-containing protein